MRVTTQTQLSEQNYSDWLAAMQEEEPSGKRVAVAYEFNNYASLLGIPMRLTATSPIKLARIARGVIASFNHTPIAPRKAAFTFALGNRIKEAWGL